MSQSHKAGQICDSCSIVEDLCCHTISLALVNSTTWSACCDSAGILSAVLEKVEGFVEVDGGRV